MNPNDTNNDDAAGQTPAAPDDTTDMGGDTAAAAKCDKCGEHDVVDGNCSGCQMESGMCTCPPAADDGAGSPVSGANDQGGMAPAA